MNNYSLNIASLIRFNTIVFNTLEYAMKKDQFVIEAFKARKDSIKSEITNNTPLKQCLDNSGEAGEKLKKQIDDMYEAIYGDNSTIIKFSSDGKEIRVDSSQHLAVYDAVVPVWAEMNNVIGAHIQGALKNNSLDEEQIPELVKKSAYFFQGFMYMIMLDDLDKLFAEYNKARNEAKGAITPQSNFIQNDISKLVGLMNFVRARGVLTTTTYYYEVVDPLFALLETTSGRRDLPEGKNFGDLFVECKKIVREHTQKWEVEWQEAFKPVMEKFDARVLELQGKKEEEGSAA